MDQDMTLRLPDGRYFHLWETVQKYDRELHVDGNHLAASDKNDGTPESPLKTINAAASIAMPGTRVWIHTDYFKNKGET